MRLVAVADIHGAYSTVDAILEAEAPFDAVIISGDLTTHGTVHEARTAIETLQRFGKPLFAVAGNMDLPQFESTYTELGVNLNARGVQVGDVGFFGVAGSPFTPMHTPYELPEDEILRRAEEGWKQAHRAPRSVFVPHAPPRSTKLDRIRLGAHVGSVAVREFVECHQPDVLICGHIHESRGIDILGKTQMVNCGPAEQGSYAVITIDQEVAIELKFGGER
ncbi:MAG TPA: YfcE family phosphodiesterase [Bacteroidetes bacterium]|nr:YfcE family phosphodiesterase [Bacteroidota bacterium]